MNRSRLGFLLLTCPLLACADDISEVVTGSSSSGEDSMGTVTVNPTTITPGDTESTTEAPTTSLDGTGTSGTSDDTGSTGSTGDTDGTTDTGSTGSTGSTGDTDGTTDTGSTGSTGGSSSDSGSTGGSSSDSGGSSSSGGGPGCGDGAIDMGEDCDGVDLAGNTCLSLGMGFSGGTLACAADCAFDTSACFACGDGAIDAGESCDGASLGGSTCATLGFAGGTLACDLDCAFDTSACFACGDGAIDPGESCDGADLGGSACTDLGLGFTGGTLACAADCAFDTSACTSCGNGVIDAGESCDGVVLGGQACPTLGLGFTGGPLGCDATCGYDTAACTSLPLPGSGQLIVTEIMQNPNVLLDADGEWFELYNPTAASTFQLRGCTIEGNGFDPGFTIDTDLEIGPESYLVLATDSLVDQGFTADYQWADAQLSLGNASDTVRVVCDGVVVDEVSWDDGVTFPDPIGASMSLSFDTYDEVLNDQGDAWCDGTTSYNGDFGTPGGDNPLCTAPPVVYPIDFCRLQFPTTIAATPGTNVTVFGRLYSAGLTDLSGVNDPAPEVMGWVGFGPDGSNPAVDPGWTWVAGVPNPGYGPASPGYEANNDEYQANLVVPAVGSYDFAYRFSGDSGTSFAYCDGQPAGNSDGYQPANAGQMTVTPPNLYFSEYVEGSSSNKAIEIYNAMGSAIDLSACTVRFYFNGNPVAGTTIPLAGNLASHDVWVVCDDSIVDTSFCDVLNNAANWYNGNDAVELSCGGTVVDVIGQTGFNPGTEWIVGGVGTADETLRRSCAVTSGDPVGGDAFDPSLQWSTFPQNTFADLGQYVCP